MSDNNGSNINVENVVQQWERERQVRAENTRKEAAKVMRRHRIAKVTAVFDGSGDSGDFHSVRAIDRDGKVVGLANDELAHLEDHMCGHLPGGWEINEGSSGKLIMLPDGTVRGQIGWNVMSVDYESINGGLPEGEEDY